MVNVSLSRLSTRVFQKDPPRGKGSRLRDPTYDGLATVRVPLLAAVRQVSMGKRVRRRGGDGQDGEVLQVSMAASLDKAVSFLRRMLGLQDKIISLLCRMLFLKAYRGCLRAYTSRRITGTCLNVYGRT